MLLLPKASGMPLRAVEVGADDAFVLARAANIYSFMLNDPGTADAIADQAIAVNPNFSMAWRIRGWASIHLGNHERAIEQFQHAMRLNPLDPEIYLVEVGLALCQFLIYVALRLLCPGPSNRWLVKTSYDLAMEVAMCSYAMLGRIEEAQMMLARRREGREVRSDFSILS